MKKLLFILPVIALLAIGVAGFMRSQDEPVGYRSIFKTVTPLNAVTATTTSSAIEIKGAKRATLFLGQGLVDAVAGQATTTFTVTVSVDDVTYVAYNKLIDNVTNSNAQNLTRVASKDTDSGANYILTMDLTNDAFSSFKVTATTLTGVPVASSTATVKALIEF